MGGMERTMTETAREKADEKLEEKGLTRLTGIMTVTEQEKVIKEHSKAHMKESIGEFTGKLIMLGLKAYKEKKAEQKNKKLFFERVKELQNEKKGRG